MNKLVLLLSFLIFSNLLVAQNLLTQEGTSWKEVSCGHWSNMVGIYYVDNLRIEGDTTFYGTDYKKLYITKEEYIYASITNQPTDSLSSSIDQFFGGIRMDEQKLYVAAAYYDLSMDEKLIFDFSAHPGDTVQIWYDTMGYHPVVIDNVYGVTVADGSVRNRYNLKEITTGNPLSIYWIDGIGSNYGLLSSHFVYMSDLSKTLRCVKQNEEVIYDYDPSSYFYCSVNPLQDCEAVISTGVDKIDESINATLSPNPMNASATLKFDNLSNEVYCLDVYDSKGMLMNSKSNISNGEVSIERANLSSGLYIVRLYSTNQTVFIGKLIIE